MKDKICQQEDNGSLPHDELSTETVVSQRTEGDISQPHNLPTKPIAQCGESPVESLSNSSHNAKVAKYIKYDTIFINNITIRLKVKNIKQRMMLI